MKALVGKRLSQTVPFLGEKIKIFKLSVKDVLQVQSLVREMQEIERNTDLSVEELNVQREEKNLEIVRMVIRLSVEGAEELSDEEFNSFPMEELGTLANNIMEFSGLRGDTTKGKP